MVEARIETLQKHGKKLFEERMPLTYLWQEIADNFYPERADFTVQRNVGYDFASNLTNSYPIIARRSMGDILSTMLRPVETEWFYLSTMREDKEDNAAKQWLEWASNVQRRAMYARKAMFDRATKEADHDFAAFGQCAISVELNKARNELLYRCWHLRDIAWVEDATGTISTRYMKWNPTVTQLNAYFNGNISSDAKKILKDQPYSKIECMRVIIQSEDYDSPKKWRTPWVSVYYECATHHILEEIGVMTHVLSIPRWQTVSGSQYAYSPATVAALPDARLIQAMTLTLLEAGEKAVNPPLKTPGDVLRSDLQLFAGGLTVYDAEYDEATGRVLEPLYNIDKSAFNFSAQMAMDTRQMIGEAFFLNKIGLPPAQSGDMTAFEIGQRVQEYIRNAMPIFAPMEAEYNGSICDLTFETMKFAGGFGPVDSIPESLRGSDIQFRFKSPLHDAIEQKKVQIFQQAQGLIAQSMALDPSSAFLMDSTKALRDALEGNGTPADWLNDEEEVEDMKIEAQQAQQAQQLLALTEAGGQAAEQVGKGAQAIQNIGGV